MNKEKSTTSELLENDKVVVESIEDRFEREYGYNLHSRFSFDETNTAYEVNWFVIENEIKKIINSELSLQKKQILDILADEINIANTHNQSTSRITSAYNRVDNLK
jgi:hypothetical protein